MVTAPLGASEPETSTRRAAAGAADARSTAAGRATAGRVPRIVPTMVDAGDRPVKPPSLVALALDAHEVRVLRDALVHHAAGRVHDRAEAVAVEEPLSRGEAGPGRTRTGRRPSVARRDRGSGRARRAAR